jgi:hypothetical protein
MCYKMFTNIVKYAYLNTMPACYMTFYLMEKYVNIVTIEPQ